LNLEAESSEKIKFDFEVAGYGLRTGCGPDQNPIFTLISLNLIESELLNKLNYILPLHNSMSFAAT